MKAVVTHHHSRRLHLVRVMLWRVNPHIVAVSVDFRDRGLEFDHSTTDGDERKSFTVQAWRDGEVVCMIEIVPESDEERSLFSDAAFLRQFSSDSSALYYACRAIDPKSEPEFLYHEEV